MLASDSKTKMTMAGIEPATSSAEAVRPNQLDHSGNLYLYSVLVLK